MPSSSTEPTELDRRANAQRQPLIAELWGFMSENKKWWLLPIFFVLALVAALIALGGTGAAPFIYTIF